MFRKFLATLFSIIFILSGKVLASEYVKEKAKKHDQYHYSAPIIISANTDIFKVEKMFNKFYLKKNFIGMSTVVEKYDLIFDVSNVVVKQKLVSFAVHAVAVGQPNLAYMITHSFNANNEEHMIDLATIAKSLVSSNNNKIAMKIVKQLETNEKNNKVSDIALGKIAKRAVYTPGAEFVAFEIEKNRPNLSKEIKDLIALRKIGYDEKIWNAKVAFMTLRGDKLSEEILHIVNSYDPNTKDGARKLTILAKSALRAEELELAMSIVSRIESNFKNNENELASIAKASAYIHGGLPIAMDIASKLGNSEYCKNVKKLVYRIAEEHSK